MTRTEYEDMMGRVLSDAERLEVDGREVVLVMSRNIYRIICSYERTEPLNLLNTEPYAYGAYCGMRVGVIDEPVNRNIEGIEDMVAPALVGMAYNPGVNRLGDVIVVSEENDNRLYQMTNENPAQFNDMGLTVRFGNAAQGQNAVLDVAAMNTTNNTITVTTTDNGAGVSGIQFNEAQPHINANNADYANVLNNWAATLNATITQQEMERIADAFNAAHPEVAYTDTATTANWWYRSPTPSKRKKAACEPELNPGDTKLLDEFLESFSRNSGMMQMGG